MASDDIKTLMYPQSIRTRPGMFIGSTEDASNIFREVIDNVIDEMYRCKECDTLDIRMNDHVYTISDNGRGFPIKESTLIKGQTMAREATSNINSGSKFDNKVTSIGMNGSGIKCTNALSDVFILYSKMSLHNLKDLPSALRKSYKNEKYYYIKYEKGEFISEGFCNLNSDYSTIVQFKPDATIFESIDAYMPTELRYIEYILSHKYNKTIKVLLNGQPYKDELEKLHTEFSLGDGKYDILAGVSLKNKYENGTIDGSVNGLYCPNGLHIRWFTRAFVKAFNQMFYSDYSWDDVMYGLDVRVILLYPEVSYTAQIKNCLASLKGYPSKGEQESDKLVEPILKVLKKDKQYWEIHNKRIQSLIDAKNKINTRDLVKDTFDVDNKKRKKLPSKLMDCTTKDRSKAELFLCFTGDTEIWDCNFNKIKFNELTERVDSGESIYTYSCNCQGEIEPAKITECRMIKQVNKLVKITLDNGTSFKCTLDHRIMLRDGSYKEAKDLMINESLMPLYYKEIPVSDYGGATRRQIRHNIRSRNGNYRHEYAYSIMGRHPDVQVHPSVENSNWIHTHHIDHNPLNDSPSNLQKIDATFHRSHHGGVGLLEHYKKGESNYFYKWNDKKYESVRKSLREYWNSDAGILRKEELRNYARIEWSNLELKKWRADETSRYAKEHPDLIKKYRDKATISFLRNMISKVKSECTIRGLELTYTNYDMIAWEICKRFPGEYSGKRSSIERASKFLPTDELSEWRDDRLEELENYIRLVYNYMYHNNIQFTYTNFNKSRDNIEYNKYRPGYLSIRNRHPELLEKVESEFDNHKVQSIEFINCDNEPVYCLEVDNPNHNFPLSNGIFVHNCEGASAQSSLVQARDSKIHAVLALRGKMLNTVGKTIEEIIGNKEVNDIINAIGIGTRDYCKPKNIRYGKIIITADSDSDGYNIASLILGLLYTHIPKVIEMGIVYLSVQPLFKVGNQYVYSDTLQGVNTKGKTVERYKGLGSVNPKDMKSMALDPKTRKLVKVTMKDAEYATQIMTSAAIKGEILVKNDVIVI